MTEAVIASYARTPIGKAYRGALNATHGATLGAHVVAAAVQRAGLDPSEVEDVVIGGAIGEGTTGATSRARSRCAPGFRSRRPAVTIDRLVLSRPADDRASRLSA